jgi:hypothetical protein
MFTDEPLNVTVAICTNPTLEIAALAASASALRYSVLSLTFVFQKALVNTLPARREGSGWRAEGGYH